MQPSSVSRARVAVRGSLCALLALAAPASASALGIQPGSAVHEESLLGVRYQSFRNTRAAEVQLGVPDLAKADRRVERDVKWVSGGNRITLTFDPAADRLTTVVSNAAGDFSLEVPELAEVVATLGSGRWSTGDLNALRISLASNDPGATVAFRDVALNGTGLGDIEPGGSPSGTWTVSGFDFGGGFVLTGTIELDGRFSARAKRSRLDVEVGIAKDPTCIVDESVAAVRTILDAESPYHLQDIDGMYYDLPLMSVRWSFLDDDVLYVDGTRDRSYSLCSTPDGVMMSIGTGRRRFPTAHFLVDVVADGFAMMGQQKTTGEDGLPTYSPAGINFHFTKN
jgi:hypothetical protein